MQRFFTLGGLAARSLQPERDALGRLVSEVEQGRLMAMDSIHWTERRDERGRMVLRERDEFRSMRVSPEAVIAWAERFPTYAAEIFAASVIATLAPSGASFYLEQ